MILNVKELYLYVKRGDFMIGIIGAMEEEVKALLDKTEDIHENKILDCVFYEGKIDNKQVVILRSMAESQRHALHQMMMQSLSRFMILTFQQYSQSLQSHILLTM